jgi:hypothetical protein
VHELLIRCSIKKKPKFQEFVFWFLEKLLYTLRMVERNRNTLFPIAMVD